MFENKNSMKWKDHEDELRKFICEENKSYEELGRIYGVSGAAVKKAALRLGIELTPRRSINPSETFDYRPAKKGACLNCGKEIILYKSHTGKYCSIQCQHEYKYKTYISNWKSGKIDGLTNGYSISKIIRRYLLEQADYKCERCGWCETNESHPTPPLQIHHIDGDCLNNKEENLIVLCPNCHALTDNYGSKNKNGLKDRTKYFKKDIDAYNKKLTDFLLQKSR